MPSNYDYYFSLYSGVDPAAPKQAEVSRASQQKMEELRRITDPTNAFKSVAGNVTNDGLASASEMERDFRTMNPQELQAKYGPEVANQMNNARSQAGQQYDAIASYERPLYDKVIDAGAGVAAAAIESAKGIGSWAAGEIQTAKNSSLINPAVPIMGEGIDIASKFAGVVSDAFRRQQSDNLRDNNAIVAAQNDMAERDNEAAYQENIRNGDSVLGSKIAREVSNFGDAASNILNNGTVTGGVIADGAGSLIAAGGIGKVLKLAGAAALGEAGAGIAGGSGIAAKVAKAIGASAPMSLSIGLQEGGGAYESTKQDALAVLKDRADLDESQKEELANAAAVIAARTQAPIGMVTGLLVAKFEGKLFERNFGGHLPTPKTALVDAFKETLEETAQSVSGQMAQNAAISATGIDPNRDIASGTGEQGAYGSVGGFGSSGVVSVPGLAANAVVAPVKAVGGVISNAAEKAARMASPFSMENLNNRFSAFRNKSADVTQTTSDSIDEMAVPEETKTAYKAYADKLYGAVSSVKMSDLVDLANRAKDTTISVADRLKAAASLKMAVDASKAVIDVTPTVIDTTTMPEDMKQASALIGSIQDNPEIAKALGTVSKLASEAVIDVEAVVIPENTDAINAAIVVAEEAPQKVNPEVNKIILKHNEEGKINLTPVQKATLEASASLAQTVQDHQAKASDLLKTNSRLVSEDIQNDGAEALKDITNAVRRNDIESAKLRLEDLGMLSQLFQNKLAALNEHARTGQGQKTNAVQYDNLIGEIGKRRWIPIQKDKGMWYNPRVPKTVAFAQSVENDSRALTTLFNNIASSFPELGIKPMEYAFLDGTEEAAAQQEQAKQDVVVAEPAPEPVSEPTPAPAPYVKPVQEELPLWRSAPKKGEDSSAQAEQNNSKTSIDPKTVTSQDVVEEAAVVETKTEATSEATEAKDTAQSKGGDTSTEAVKSEAKTEVKAEPKPVPDTELTIDQLFPSLIGSSEKSNLSSWFKKAFKLRKEARTRTRGSLKPLSLIKTILASKETLTDFVGKALIHDFNDKIAATYQGYLSEAAGVGASMQESLNAFLDKKLDGVSIRDHILKGTNPVSGKGRAYEVNRMINGKALNLVDVSDDGKMAYNSELLGGAILAGMQWLLVSERSQGRLKADAVAKILGISENHPRIEDFVAEMNNGMGTTAVKRTLANEIVRYWDVAPNNDTELGYVKGISEAIASELMKAFVQRGLLLDNPLTLTQEDDGIPEKKRVLNRYTPNFNERAEALFAYPTAIEEAVFLDPERNHINKAPEKVATTQMNNPRVRNTGNQIKAADHENNTPYRINTPVVDFFEAMTLEGFLYVFASGDLKNRPLNRNHALTLKGRNNTATSAYRSIVRTVAEIRNVAAATDQNVEDVPSYFEHNFSSLGRMQQLGKNAPQGSKAMREALLSTWSTLDLSGTNEEHMGAYMLALGQALEIKVHTKTLEAVTAEVTANLNDAAHFLPAVEMLQKWLLSKDKKISGSDMQILRKALRKDITVVGFHALMDYARFQNSNAEERKAFRTGLYLEADGVTNGPVNAMGMLTPGSFSPQWFINMAKGGLFIENTEMTMNKQRDKDTGRDPDDLYTTMAAKLRTRISGLYESLRQLNSSAVMGQLTTVMELMSSLMPDDIMLDEKNEWLISRGVTKNPLTITLYGSGARGIAENLVKSMLDNIYERMSNAADLMNEDKSLTLAEAMFGDQATESVSADFLLNQMETRLNNLITQHVYKRKGVHHIRAATRTIPERNGQPARSILMPGIRLKNADPTQFTISKDQIASITSNMQYLVVDEMTNAIADTVGKGLIETLTNLRKATQAQSIITEYAFQRGVERALEKKRKDPKWQESDFLSDKELDEIQNEISHLAPTLETKDQRYDLSGGLKTDIQTNEFGKGYDGYAKSDAYIYAPSNAGVSGIPTTVVGFGDGMMMQRLATLKNAVAGTLKVFDGINLPLDKIKEGSQQANEAAYQSWLGNPLKAVHESYARFMKDLPVATMSEQELDALAKALFERDVYKQGVTKQEIIDEMKLLEKTMKIQSIEIEARHNTLDKMNLSVDQMASAGATYQVTGKLDMNGLSSHKLAFEANKLYREEFVRLMDEADVSEKFPEELRDVLVEDEATGVYTIDGKDLIRVVDKVKIPAQQKAIFKDIIKSGLAKDYKLVFGPSWRLSAYAAQESLHFPDNVTENDKGLISISDKVIFLNNSEPSSETIVHELVHAATFEKLIAHYSGKDLGSFAVEQVQAIQRLEGLMEQFLDMGDTLNEISAESVRAYDNAVRAIEKERSDTSNSEAVRKAAALNEFMAWSLSNQDLVRLQERTKVVNPLVRISKAMYQAIRQLIWGKKYAPKIRDDMHSNLRFNTNVLLNSGPSVQGMLLEKLLYQSAPLSEDSRLKRIEKIFQDKIVAHLSTAYELKSDQDYAFIELGNHAQKIGDALLNNGFPMGNQESKTFRMILAAMSTQAKLDPNGLIEAQHLYAHVVKTVKREDFMDDPLSTDPNDIYLAQQKLDGILGNTILEKDSMNRSSLLSVFLALSMTNNDFKKVLAKLKVPNRELGKWNSLDGVLENVGVVLMEKLGQTMSGANGKATNVDQAVGALSDSILKIAAKTQDGIFAQGINLFTKGVNSVNGAVVDVMGAVSTGIVKTTNKGLAATNNKIAVFLLESTKLIGSMINETNAAEASKGLMSSLNKSNVFTSYHELVNEFIGRTDENAGIYDMIKLVRSWVQQTRQQFREKLPTVIASKFTRTIDENQWKDMYRGLGKTDVAGLVMSGLFSVADTLNLLNNPSRIAREISTLEATLQGMDALRWPMWQVKAKELAEFMHSGKHNGNLLRNAYAVANLWGEAHTSRQGVSNLMVASLDALISLYALDTLPDTTKNSLSFLAQHESTGLEYALSYLVGQRETEMSKTSWTAVAEANHFKGYIPSESEYGLNLIVAPIGDEYVLRSMGYIRKQNYVGSKAEIGQVRMAYYFSDVGGKASYNQGIVQNIRPTFSGVDPVTGFSNNMTTGGQITDIVEVRRITANARLNRNGSELLMPIRDGNGKIIAYERGIDPAMAVLMKPKEHLAQAIGIWRGRQVEEVQSIEFNRDLVDQVEKMWTRDRALRSDEYVNVFDKDVLKKDPVLADSVNLININTRKAIELAFGKRVFMVRKDMLNDVLGYRNASIGDLWTGKTRWSPATQKAVTKIATAVFGVDAYRKLLTAEKFIQNIISDARVTIVIKSMIVPMANLTSNVFQLMSRGVGLGDILKGMPKKTAEIDAFVKGRLRRLELEADLRAVLNDPIKSRQIRLEIQTIRDNNRRMSIWPLIEAGEFASISDVGISQDEILLSEGRLSAYIEKLTSKLPDGLKTIGKYGIISRDTALFKGLQRAVEYGDFLGKAVLYDHLTQEKNLSKEEALAKITEEFVNYDRLPGRSRAYLENIGLLWFWNFKIRSTKIALSMIRNNPVHSLMALTGLAAHEVTSIGSPIFDNAVSVVGDGRSHWSIGPRMALHAHALNPWYNAAT